MKISTFNVNSIRARKDLVIEWLKKRGDIDILSLQELKCQEEDFPFEDFKKIGFFCEVFGQKAYNGVAICSKYKFDEVYKGFGDKYWDREKRFIRARINGIDILNVYVPHGEIEGEKHIYKLKFYLFLKEYIKNNFNLNSSKLILLGDMNVARDEIDVWDPNLLEGSIGFMDDERRYFEELLSIGLIDLYRELHPKEHGFTWWDYRNGAIWRDYGMRIDYILASSNLAKRCKDIEVDKWSRKRRKPTPSDHAPIVAWFDLN